MRRALGAWLLALGAAVGIGIPAAARAQTEAPQVPEEALVPAAAPAPGPTPPPPAPAPPPDEPVARASASAPASADARVAVAASPGSAPLVGYGDDGAYLRSPSGALVLLPAGWLALDGHATAGRDGAPGDGFLVRGARLELAGWIGRSVAFSLAGEYSARPGATASGTGAAAGARSGTVAVADAFVAVVPWSELAVLQVGQFAAPFTLDNSTPDLGLDFLERALAAQALGVPDRREVGAMVHGHDEARRFHYSYGVFNGDGPGLRNADKHFDSIARAWIAPLAFAGGGGLLRDVTIGGSARLGDREDGGAPASQTTQGGLPFLSFAAYLAGPSGTTPAQLRQMGLLRAFAGELNVPVGRRFGARAELVWRLSPLSEMSLADPARPVILGGANLDGWAAYAEGWAWILGDDRARGPAAGDRQGLRQVRRWRGEGAAAARVDHGLLVAVRIERLDEQITHERDAAVLGLRNPALGITRVTAATLAASYWHARRFRAALDYTFNRLGGDTAQIRALGARDVHELGLRLAVVL